MQKLKLMWALAAVIALGAINTGQAWATSPPENTVKPGILGAKFEIGKVISGSHGTWTNSPESYSYQWQRCNAGGGECANISGATSTNYTIAVADAEHTLVIRVTAKNSGGEGVASSNPTKVVPRQVEFIPAKKAYPVAFNFGTILPSIQWSNGNEVNCESISGAGSITGPNTISSTSMTLTGCRAEHVTCKTLEATNLHGHFGYISKAAKAYGLVLEESGPLFASFNCSGITYKLRSAIIGGIGPVNTLTSSFTLDYQSRGGTQAPNAFEGGPTQQLEWSAVGETYAPFGIDSQKTTFTTSEKGELIG